MIRINLDESVDMVQGDTGSLYFIFEDYKLTENDKITFHIMNGTECVGKIPIIVETNGGGYFRFDESKTRSLPYGKYFYDIVVEIESVGKFHSKQGVLNIKRGCNV